MNDVLTNRYEIIHRLPIQVQYILLSGGFFCQEVWTDEKLVVFKLVTGCQVGIKAEGIYWQVAGHGLLCWLHWKQVSAVFLHTGSSLLWVLGTDLMMYLVIGVLLSTVWCDASHWLEMCHDDIVCRWFLPARRYASAGNSDRNVSVRPSVSPSVTCRYCVKTKKASVMISSPSGSPKTLVF